MTLDDAIELRAVDQLVGLDEEPRVVLDVIYSDFNSPSIGSQWRRPVLNLETGRRESWPNARLGELERVK